MRPCVRIDAQKGGTTCQTPTTAEGFLRELGRNELQELVRYFCCKGLLRIACYIYVPLCDLFHKLQTDQTFQYHEIILNECMFFISS